MKLDHIFDVFSRRQRSSKPEKPLTETFRNRILLLCRDTFSEPDEHMMRGDYLPQFWHEIHSLLQYRLGKPSLTGRVSSPGDDSIAFLVACEDNYFLDFVEYIFRVDAYRHVRSDENQLVQEVNQLLLIDDLPYAMTLFIREAKQELLFGSMRDVSYLVSYPKLIARENQYSHGEIIAPALTLLADKALSSANAEFIEALEDYRKGDLGDALTKCGSAFESTMKLICAKRRWPFADDNTAAVLLHTVIQNAPLDTFFEQPLLIVASLRNRLSKSHGAGASKRSPSPATTRYALNATAAAMIFLVDECL